MAKFKHKEGERLRLNRKDGFLPGEMVAIERDEPVMVEE